MKLSSFKTLQLKDPRAAMIFDLTERFPRGPKAKLRAHHYDKLDKWGHNAHVPESKQLIGGDLGYDLFELYELTKQGWYRSNLESIVVTVEDCAMGSQVYDYGTHEYKNEWCLFKRGPQITRRLRRLEQRLRDVRRMVEEQSKANLYEVRVGNLREDFKMFGDSETHVKQTYELLLKAGFEQACEKKLMSRGGYYDNEGGECRLNIRFDGPSHGPHEIMAANQGFVKALRAKQQQMRDKIAELQGAIEAADDLAMLVDMFTLNTCAQQFGADGGE